MDFCTKVNTTDFISDELNDEFTDWKEKVNPFSAAILLYGEHDCIECIARYFNVRRFEKRAILLARYTPDFNAFSELFRQNVNLQNSINHKIKDNLRNEAWNSSVKPYVGYTPLHLAVHEDFSEVVEILLKETDIDPNVKNNEGLTPL
jgi:hypothetical protein